MLTEGPWIIGGHYLTIQKWKPNLNPTTERITSTAAWIRFPEMPIKYLDQKILTQIGNKIGKTIKVDRKTAQQSRGARICVEIDLEKPLIPKIILGNRWQRIEYEGLQQVCFVCGKFGHKFDECPSKVKRMRKWFGVMLKKDPRIPLCGTDISSLIFIYALLGGLIIQIDRVRSYCLADLGFSNLHPPLQARSCQILCPSIRIASHSLLLSLYSAFVPCPIQGSLGGAHSDPFIPISGKLGRLEVLLSRKVH